MKQIVSITSQGQLTIPKSLRDFFGIQGSTKALVSRQGNKLIVEPKADFWDLEGALSSDVALSDSQLKEARLSFAKKWGQNG